MSHYLGQWDALAQIAALVAFIGATAWGAFCLVIIGLAKRRESRQL